MTIAKVLVSFYCLILLPTCCAFNKLTAPSSKEVFLSSLDSITSLNDANEDRTELLNHVIATKQEVNVKDFSSPLQRLRLDNKNPSAKHPASLDSMLPVAPGTWKVVYAPHMAIFQTIAPLQVEYSLRPDQTITSHASFASTVHLSVSGRYGSVNDEVCFVEWDKTWFRIGDKPYATLEDVPDSFIKIVVNALGQALFVRPVSVFPVSFLDIDLCVFDFALLGTRICARKQV